MEPPNSNPPNPKPQSMRVLIRPPLPPSHPHPTTQPTPTANPPAAPPPPHPPSPQNGVVVVGYIGRRFNDVSYLINRIIDSNVFGSGNLATPFTFGEKLEIDDDMKKWFGTRSISFYHDEEKGVLHLQFSSTGCPAMEEFSNPNIGFDSVLEDRELGDLQAMLFMFSVCHVVVLIQEGSRFDTQILKKFRILQAAKHAMFPFMRSRATSPVTSSSHFSSLQTSVSGTSSSNPSPRRSRGILSRNASAIALMSGLGSHSSMLPGQCSPVLLFVFLDDFADVNPTGSTEESAETLSLNHSSNLNSLPRSNLPTKGSGSVVMLARPVSKSEGGFRKKLQSSLEAQIRFSIKKCRTLSGSETSHGGSRSGGISNAAPLFSLDASKAVALVDLSSNKQGESLEYACGLVEDILNGKATSDSLLLESLSLSASKEDILSVKEFIHRQSDILRGRGGLASGTNSGSAAGVGMVAVAAAAAAASAASGKAHNTPELPSFGIWLSSSENILHGILSAKHELASETEIGRRGLDQHRAVSPPREGNASKAPNSLRPAVSCLESSIGLNSKYSTMWCEKVLPVAKEVYLSELPSCYSTLQHEAHLDKALRAFNSMVKGPAVERYMKQLKEECTSMWTAGRQLCDAVSLTGKPCMHQRHSTGTGGSLLSGDSKPHSSGYVFLHACACGRTRRLRPDPFDFETANVTSSFFPDCDKHLPALLFPQGNTKGPIQPSSWSLIRVGGARYYEPSKGLLQSGFCAAERFLLKWAILLEKQKSMNDFTYNALQQASLSSLSGNAKDESVADGGIKKADAVPVELHDGTETQEKPSSENLKTENKNVSFGVGVSNFTMRKAFSEVVAGSAATDSRFPPLQSRKQPLPNTEKDIKHRSIGERVERKVNEVADNQSSQKIPEISSTGNNVGPDIEIPSNPFLQIGSNVVPVNTFDGDKVKDITSLKHIALYIGFEYECPHGHRFILTPDHLSDLGSSYLVPEESLVSSSAANSDHKVGDLSKSGKVAGHGKAYKQSNVTIASAVNKRSSEKSKERVPSGILSTKNQMQFSRPLTDQTKTTAFDDSLEDIGASLQSVMLDDGGLALSLLNRDLPIYMSCPYCKDNKNKKNPRNLKFAGLTSQLQRIFLVTPPFPIITATSPVVQFNMSCLPASVPDRKKKLQFSVGCQVILPPESFLSLRLPFIYGVELEDGSLQPLKPFEHQPEMTAWIIKGTTLQVASRG